jgi:[ribosomal protein S5]-alanine N-acetyltransferase
MAGPVLLTRRLRLEPFAARDTDELHGVFTDAAVRKFLLDDEVVPREWVAAEIGASVTRFAGGSAGLWSVCPRESRRIIGFTGFRYFHEPPELQLLYGLLPEHWGQGMASEAAAAAVQYAFDALGHEQVGASADVENAASFRVMERLGMRYDRLAAHAGRETIFYTLRRPPPAAGTPAGEAAP